LPTITPIARELTVEDARQIIELAEADERRRSRLTAALRAALEAGELEHALEVAREICGLENPLPPAA
jgi:hypothetical protein